MSHAPMTSGPDVIGNRADERRCRIRPGRNPVPDPRSRRSSLFTARTGERPEPDGGVVSAGVHATDQRLPRHAADDAVDDHGRLVVVMQELLPATDRGLGPGSENAVHERSVVLVAGLV